MDRITFSVNGIKCSVGAETSSDVSLNDYVREKLNLRGTKYMCKEGGCGACILAVAVPPAHTAAHQHTRFAVNSCLVSVTSCQDWEVTTVEGIGGRGRGYHPVQRSLAENNGTQCGYCSPGWVMSMYSLLESNHYDLTQKQIENSFASNTCRCTGYRPILDAFKSFAKDAPKPKSVDIEELDVCKRRGECAEACDKGWCFVNKAEVRAGVKKLKLKDDRVWFKVNTIADVFLAWATQGTDSYMLVNGNTGRGAVPIFAFPRVLIDISSVQQLQGHYVDQNLVVGAGVTLTELMELCKTMAQQRSEFAYLHKLYEHMDLVAHIPVRNIGTVAGNLMVKHRMPTFSSDIFLLLETVGATLTIMSRTSTVQVTPKEFLALDMTEKIITQFKLPPLSKKYVFESFKIMPRSQNAHASVNAAFLYEFSDSELQTVASARIVMGGLSGKFVHASETESFLVGKRVFSNAVLQQALRVLQRELVVEEIAGELKPEFRKKLALGLFYKGLLNIIPKEKVHPKYRSGADDLKKTRPLSSGIEVYDTNPVIWPITEPMPRTEALIQCAGEAKYVNDIPTQPDEVFCAFVTADICTGDIESIDPSPALKLPGVLAFFSAKDIPGTNSYISQKILAQLVPEEIFADERVKYYDQPIGIIVAETEKLANRAALLVQVKYKIDNKKPVLTIQDAIEREPNRVSLFFVIPARDRGLNVQRVIKGYDNISWQYHFTMETLSCVTRPNEDGMDVYPTTQFTDSTHLAISDSLNIPQNIINLELTRLGGAYGIKLTRGNHVAAACALVTHLTGRPCRFVMSIQANMRCIGKRLPVYRGFEVGVSDSGEIQYLEYDFFEDNGYIFADLIIAFAMSNIKNCYDNRRWQTKLFNVVTDTASNTYARAPGGLEAVAMTEYIMERISVELDMDPVQVRRSNLNPQYPETAEMLQTLLTDSKYYERKKEIEKFNKLNRWKKRGLRIALLSFSVSNIYDFQVLMSVYHGDGTVAVKLGAIEMGQGINTKVRQVVAYTLNISLDKVKIKPTDIASTPNSFASAGSRATQEVCFGAIKCCQLLLDRLTVVREALNNPTWELLVSTAHNRGISLQTSYHVTPNDQSVYRVGGAAAAEVELDIITGEHHIRRVDIVEDAGTSVNPELDIGQIEGAFMMGVGYWTHEHQIYDEHTGELLTDRTWYYHVPLAKDIPIDFRVQLRRNSYNPLGTLGAKAVAEPPICLAICVAFALREAITASRQDSGYPKNKWFNVDGPHTIEANVLKADVHLEEFLFE